MGILPARSKILHKKLLDRLNSRDTKDFANISAKSVKDLTNPPSLLDLKQILW
jgi:hypothetical protein